MTPDQIKVHYDCRLLPGEMGDRQQQFLINRLAQECEVQRFDYQPGYSIDPNERGFQKLAQLVKKAHAECGRDVIPIPMLLPASSDSSIYARLGKPIIGFAPLWFPPSFPGFALIHAANERIPISAYEIGIHNYFTVLERFGQVVAI